MQAPVLMKAIPTQVVNEQSAYGPFDLKRFINAPDGSNIFFRAELVDGRALPQGMICTTDGMISGIPPKGSYGNYEVLITAENQAGNLQTKFLLTIKPNLAETTETEYVDKLKAEVWNALENNMPVPDLSELYNRSISEFDVYYLLERWATLTIWDAFNLDPAGPRHLMQLDGASPHFYVYDRGSCIVMTPVDLFSHERTLEDALQTARAMTREVYKRGWTIEMAGFEKLTRAVWVEAQVLKDKYSKVLDILHYDPSVKDMRIYLHSARHTPFKPEPL